MEPRPLSKVLSAAETQGERRRGNSLHTHSPSHTDQVTHARVTRTEGVLHVTEVVLVGRLHSRACWSASGSSGSCRGGCFPCVTPLEVAWGGVPWAPGPASVWSTAGPAGTVLSLLHFIKATRSLMDFPTIFASLSWKKPDST